MAVVCGDHDLWAAAGLAFLSPLADHLALIFNKKEIADRNTRSRNYLSDRSDEVFEDIHGYFHLAFTRFWSAPSCSARFMRSSLPGSRALPGTWARRRRRHTDRAG